MLDTLLQWERTAGNVLSPREAERLSKSTVYRDAMDRLTVTVDVSFEELWPLRFSDYAFDERTGKAAGVPHLRRGVSGEERVAELRASVEERIATGLAPFTTPVEVNFGAGKKGPYLKDGHHRLGLARELRIKTLPADVPRGIARELGWLDPARQMYAATFARCALKEYQVYRDDAGRWAARLQKLPERLGDAVPAAVLLGGYATQPEAMVACEEDARDLERPRAVLREVDGKATALAAGFEGGFSDAVAGAEVARPSLYVGDDGRGLALEVKVDPPDAAERIVGSERTLVLRTPLDGTARERDVWAGTATVTYVADGAWPPAESAPTAYFPNRRAALAWFLAVEDLGGRDPQPLFDALVALEREGPGRWVNGQKRMVEDDRLDVMMNADDLGSIRVQEQARVVEDRGGRRERGGRDRGRGGLGF